MLTSNAETQSSHPTLGKTTRTLAACLLFGLLTGCASHVQSKPASGEMNTARVQSTAPGQISEMHPEVLCQYNQLFCDQPSDKPTSPLFDKENRSDLRKALTQLLSDIRIHLDWPAGKAVSGKATGTITFTDGDARTTFKTSVTIVDNYATVDDARGLADTVLNAMESLQKEDVENLEVSLDNIPTPSSDNTGLQDQKLHALTVLLHDQVLLSLTYDT